MDDSSDDQPSEDFDYHNTNYNIYNDNDVSRQMTQDDVNINRTQQRLNRKMKRKRLQMLYESNAGVSMNTREVIKTSKGHGGRQSLLGNRPEPYETIWNPN